MPKHYQIKQLPYSRELVFNLVADIESYPQFLPWCNYAKVYERSDDYILASLSVGIKSLEETFQSRVFLRSPDYIRVSYENGPLKYLYNTWNFKKISLNKTEVKFFLDFEFKSVFLKIAMGTVFLSATQVMLRAFEDRAESLYY